MSVSRGLREAVIEAAASTAGDVRQDAVEHLPALLIGVEAVVEKRAQESPALRDAEAVGVLDEAALVGQSRHVVARTVLEKRHEVADRGGSEPNDRGLLRRVHQFVNFAGLEAAFERDVRLL